MTGAVATRGRIGRRSMQPGFGNQAVAGQPGSGILCVCQELALMPDKVEQPERETELR